MNTSQVEADWFDSNTSTLCKNTQMTYFREVPLFTGRSKLCPSVGLFAGQNLEKHQILSLYAGEKLDENCSEVRGMVQDINESTYSFNLDKFFTLDASHIGNIMRYANHAMNIHHTNTEPHMLFLRGSHYVVTL